MRLQIFLIALRVVEKTVEQIRLDVKLYTHRRSPVHHFPQALHLLEEGSHVEHRVWVSVQRKGFDVLPLCGLEQSGIAEPDLLRITKRRHLNRQAAALQRPADLQQRRSLCRCLSVVPYPESDPSLRLCRSFSLGHGQFVEPEHDTALLRYHCHHSHVAEINGFGCRHQRKSHIKTSRSLLKKKLSAWPDRSVVGQRD